MSDRLRGLISCLSLIIMLASITMLIGIAGGVETDQLQIAEAIGKSIKFFVFLVIGLLGLIKTEREDGKYDRL